MYPHDTIAPNLRKIIEERGRKFEVKKSQVFQSSEHRQVLTLVKKGFVKRYTITNEGTQSIQSIFGPEFIYPLTLVFKELLNQAIYTGRETVYYETMTPATLLTLDIHELKQIVENDLTLYKDLFQVAGRRFHSNIHNLENLSLDSVYKRLAHTIAYYAEIFGEETEHGVKICLPLRHQDFGSILDVARETVSINIKKLSDKRLIKGTSQIIVVDREKLLDEAYS